MMAAAALPKTMKAWTIVRNGEPSKALALRTDAPAPPAPKGSQIVIRVTHAALNPADFAYLKMIPSWLPNRWGAVTGLDFAGEVVARGPAAAAAWAEGARVCGVLNVAAVFWGAGSLAEYILVDAGLVAAQPEGWSPANAAGLGVAAQTANVMLKAAGRVGKGTRVMVIGASGGVGTVLVQVASAMGAEVVGVCSARNHEMVRKLGAAQASILPSGGLDRIAMIDYTAHDPLHAFVAAEYGGDASRQFDFIFDCAGTQELYTHSPAYLKPEGAFLNICGDPANALNIAKGLALPRALGGTPRRYRMLGLTPSGDNARDVARWVEEGMLKEILIDSEYSMADAVKAMERVGSKRARGKVIVKVAE